MVVSRTTLVAIARRRFVLDQLVFLVPTFSGLRRDQSTVALLTVKKACNFCPFVSALSARLDLPHILAKALHFAAPEPFVSIPLHLTTVHDRDSTKTSEYPLSIDRKLFVVVAALQLRRVNAFRKENDVMNLFAC